MLSALAKDSELAATFKQILNQEYKKAKKDENLPVNPPKPVEDKNKTKEK